MTAIHETAYPRLKSVYSDRELAEIFTPTPGELEFVCQKRRDPAARFALLLLLKTCQRLGFFLLLADIPSEIRDHIASFVPRLRYTRRTLSELDKSGSRQRSLAVVRDYLQVKPFDETAGKLVDQTTLHAAETRQQLADIINVAIEELIRQRYELPGYSTLLRVARKSRRQVNDGYYQQLAMPLSKQTRTDIDGLLARADSRGTSGWNALKQEPKKPTNKQIKAYLAHMKWLQSWVKELPALDAIPVAKRRQFMYEARAIDAGDLKKLKPIKRYALVVILFHAQLHRATDDVLGIFVRKMKNLHTLGEERLRQYQLDQVQQADKLIMQFRDVLEAYQEGEDDGERIRGIGNALQQNPQDLLTACEAHLAYTGNNYFSFMLPSYQPLRPLLFNCLELIQLKSTTNDRSIVDAIQFMLANRNSHKEFLDIRDSSGKKIKLHWMPEKWRKLVLVKTTTADKSTILHRKYFELCLLSQVAQELRSADLVATESEEYSDFNTQLISWEAYEQQVGPYCEMLGLPTTAEEITQHLRQTLIDTATKLDDSYPDNEYLTITPQGPVLHRYDKPPAPSQLANIDELLKQQLETRSILDVLIEAEGWLDLHKKFGPVSGFEPKIDDPRKRFLATLFCYGCNLGPSQTAQSVKELSRKQVAWLNPHHITEERLDKAIFEVVNLYNRFRLPSYWGTGKRASADGTMWNLYEQNLLSEYHIRYGGYGGIGYYHVSDTYIALFSHFIPCGVYEAIYILDGLIKNESDIQPDTIHGDTQAQSTPVFGLAYLLGIDLMPRIRNIKDLVFYRPEKGMKFGHINSLFRENIRWDLIETHMPDMLRVALSIKDGRITPSTILRRLGTYSRKNRLYFAFRELGRVVRTIFLLKYIGDIEIQKTVQSATNKSEEFNNFTKWLFFGGNGIIAENVRHEQSKIVKYNQLVANLVILHNVDAMTRVLKDLQTNNVEVTKEVLGGLSPYRTSHINRFGDYTLDLTPSSYQPDYSVEFLF